MVTTSRLLTEPAPQWLTAAPLWEPYAAIEQRQHARRPALLRFASDTFMDDFITVVVTKPERLGEWYVTRETWRKPAPTPPLQGQTDGLLHPQAAAVLSGSTEDPELTAEPFKLYMPAHQRFYLVTANLVCRLPGLPDKMLDFSKGEQVSFVVRRLLGGQEYALVDGGWQPVEAGFENTLVPNEAQNPMFPVTYQAFKKHQRRIFAGLVPVSQREALMTAGRRSNPTPSGNALAGSEERIDQLLTLLDVDVLSPWRSLNAQAASRYEDETGDIVEAPGLAKRAIDRALADMLLASTGERTTAASNLQLQMIDLQYRLQLSSWYVLLDLADFLQRYLPEVWDAVDNSALAPSLSPTQKALYDLLHSATYRRRSTVNLTDAISDPLGAAEEYYELIEGQNVMVGAVRLTSALKAVEAKRAELEGATVAYDPDGEDFEPTNWPASVFLICGQQARATVDELAEAAGAALQTAPPDPTERLPLVPSGQRISDTTAEGDYADDTFVIRCIFERPNCPPGVRPAVVSEPTEAFQMASYFDPDAPARPFRIPMPVDTTPAGLRKFAKNTMFVLSDTLACQLEAARQITLGDLVLSVLPWPFHKDLPDPNVAGCEDGQAAFGMLCTLSIPIITICALILLIIVVVVLDTIFKWIPYLIFCLPLPGLKAKGNSS